MKKRLCHIVIYSIMTLLLCVTGFSQGTRITGTVLDADHRPLSGATVSVKGRTNVSTVTNESGTFSINASTADVLVISHVGFNPTEAKVGTAGIVNVSLTAAMGSMNEVVVVGYGTTSRRNLTTSVAKVDPKQVPQAANNSVAQLLFGRAAGLQATQSSAEPGGAINLSIRGRGNPLIVVDGIVMPYSPLEPGNSGIANELNGVRRGGFAGINPDDIESIEILKDASAAIYGVNAGNGVVLITTKKGKAGRMNVSYDGSRSVVTNMKYFEPLNATDYMTYYNQFTLDKHLLDKKMAPFGPNTPSGFVPKFSATDIANAGEGTRWLDEVLRTGSVDNHTLSINGGTDKAVYYFSGSYFKQVGTMRSSDMDRFTGRLNVTFNLNKFLSVTTMMNAARNNFTNSTAGWQNGNAGTQSFGALQAALAYPANVPVRDNTGKYTLFAVTGNPVSLLEIVDQTQNSSLMTNVSADFKIIPNKLTGRLQYGNNFETSSRDFYVPSTTFYFQQFRTRGSQNEAKRQNETMEATLNYKTKISTAVNVDAVVGTGQYTNNDHGFGSAGADMLDAIGTTNLGSATGNITINSYRGYSRTRSYFARSNFDILDKYLVSLTYRYDGYSQFFPESKYAGFPSLSLGWKISSESFMKNVSAINLLKLRASTGITGQASQGAYGVFIPDPFIIGFNNGGTIYNPYYQTQVDVPGLTWPKWKNKNIGIDFGLFKDRISGSFDYFKDDLTRLLSSANTAPLFYIGTQPINAGHQVRQGWDLGLNTANVRTSAFQWNSIINLSHVVTRWKERLPNAFFGNFTQLDDPIGSIYAYKTEGLLQIGETPSVWQPANARNPGAPKILDLNGDKKLDSADIVRYNGTPDLMIGLGNTFRYKNLDLTVFFYGQIGAWGTNTSFAWADPANIISGNQSGIQEVKNVWTTSNPKGTLPGVGFNESALGLLTGIDTRLQKSDFVRCRNITLGYTVKSNAIAQYVKSLRLFADVQNAFIITKYEIADPEVQNPGVKGGAAPYPMARTYSFGVKANF